MIEEVEKPLPVAESFAQILAADAARQSGEIVVSVPEWGLSLVVQELDVATSISIGKDTTDGKGGQNLERNLVRTFVAGVVRPPVGPDDAERLRTLNSNAFMRVIKAIQGKKNEQSKS